MNHNLPMNELSYRISESGSASLNTREILELMIGGKAENLLAYVNNDLNKIPALSISEMVNEAGLTYRKAATITACFEFLRRKNMQELNNTTIRSSENLHKYLKSIIGDSDVELFCVVYLNKAKRVIGHEIISKGGIDGTYADTRIILRSALNRYCTPGWVIVR